LPGVVAQVPRWRVPASHRPLTKEADPMNAPLELRNLLSPLVQPVNSCTSALPAFIEDRVRVHFDRVETWRGTHILHSRPAGPDAIHLSSNDYLALAAHPDILGRQAKVLLQRGNGLIMSAVFLTESSAQSRFEKRLAQFMGAEDGILTQSGFAANVGLLQSIAKPGIPVYIDTIAHMSLWEGIRAAGAQGHPFMHNDVQHLRRQIQRYGPGIVVMDSVYSTNGSLAPLADLVRAGNDYQCVVVVDESHSLGTHGEQGEGLVSALGLTDQVHFTTASLAKAFAGRAGFITCSARFKHYFAMESRPAIYSSCLLPHEIEALEATLDVIQQAHAARHRLHLMARHVRCELTALGYNVSDGTEQIIALESGTEAQTIRLRDALEERGVFGSVFCAHATPKTRALVRLSLNSGLSDVEVGRIVSTCRDIREEVGLVDWASTKRLARTPRNVRAPQNLPVPARAAEETHEGVVA
jgi:CAI-1 autoinducer synthase